jgi:hypothetical protein
MKASNLRRRLAALETQLVSAPILLQMPDGSAVTFPGEDVLGLLAKAVRGDRTPEVELLAQSVSSTEPDGAHLVDLARAILNSPTE